MTEISDQDVIDLKHWFFDYIQTFKNGNAKLYQNSLLKEKHTMQVCQEILSIGQSLHLKPEELRLAEISALFHDVGRFEQYARYQTFMDRNSENHAILGVNLLKQYQVLRTLDAGTQDLLLRVIGYHNRAYLPENETEACLFFAKLLRDADKLDIFRVVTEYYHQNNKNRNEAIELDLPDTPGFSRKVYQDLMHEKIVESKHVRNLNDFKLLQLGWVFDINFACTLRALKNRQYLDLIGEVLPQTDEIQHIINFIQSYLHKHTLEQAGRKKLPNYNNSISAYNCAKAADWR